MSRGGVFSLVWLALGGCAFVPDEAIQQRLDGDADGAVSSVFGGDDCDDDDAAVNPLATDLPGDLFDQDCDGVPFCPDGDTDTDGVCDAIDVCSLGDDGLDADADTVPDACDVCDGDDRQDLDADTVPDDCDPDDDDDDVDDVVEVAYGSQPRDDDSDDDGILDGVENANHDAAKDPSETDAASEDTDQDGLCDGDSAGATCNDGERPHGTDPLDADTDGDGLSDGDEALVTNTSPTVADTDFDGLNDGVEDATDTDPLDPDSDDDGWLDGGEDVDHDGIVDAAETDPRLADTDDDGVTDPDEAGLDHVIGPTETDPRDPDSDDDDVLDGDEQPGDFDKDGLVDARDADSDGDGITDGDEGVRGTGIHDADSDDDGLTDGYEVVTSETDPLDADDDGDNLLDGFEVNTSKTDPLDPDTDADGMDDDAEIDDGTDPLDPDTDADGASDGDEDADGTDPLDDDSDDDSRLDGAETAGGTNPLDADSNDDGTCDGPRFDKDGDGVEPVDACRWTWFVDAKAPANGDGLSWATAFGAIPSHAVAGENDVWVAAGTYRAKSSATPVAVLSGSTRVYGGFAGTETSFSQRPASLLPTILDGDRDGSGGSSLGDSPHVVTATGDVVLDGFVVRRGRATDGGAGLFADGASGLVVKNVQFENNASDGSGGAVWLRNPVGVRVENTKISGSTSLGEGGGLFVEGGDATFKNVEIFNTRGAQGGGFAARGATVHADTLWIHGARTTVGGGGGAVIVNSTVDGTGFSLDDNRTVGGQPCVDSPIRGGGGVWAAGSTITFDTASVSRNISDGGGSGLCVGTSTVRLDHARFNENDPFGVKTIDMRAGTTLTVVESDLIGNTASIIDSVDAANSLVIVDSTLNQRSGFLAMNLSDAASVVLIGSSFSGGIPIDAGYSGTLRVSHCVGSSYLNARPGDIVDHTVTTNAIAGTGNVQITADPFIRRDVDLDGYVELYLKHTGLDAQSADGPGVDGGDATTLDALLAPYGLDWRLGSTRSDRAVDTGIPDLGRHH